jgi:hypothetical protein
MVGQFDPCSQGYVSGAGRSAKWDDVPASAKDFRPNYFVLECEYHAQVTKKAKKTPGIVAGGGVAFREISNARNQRTMLASVIPAFPTNNKAPVLTVNSGHLGDGLLLSALMNSICFDYLLRMRMAAQTLNKFIIEECPVPKVPSHAQGYDAICRRLILNAARLTLIHPIFAPYWLWLREQYPELASQGWKAWWAVTESQRLRLRVELEVMAARLYRVSTEDFAWILRDDPSDLKGFFRVDQALPFSQRLTGLSLAAFRAVEESRWSVESASNLTDADFFARIGVPAENLVEPRFSESDVAAAGSGWEECERLSRSLLGGDEAVARLIRTGLSCPAGEVVPDGGAGAAVEDADHAEQASGTVVRSLFGEED